MDPTGLVWLGARYYDPKRGRFISSDPIGHPICLDLYGYANGDPINYHDLDGRFASPAYQSIRETVISTVNHPRVQGTMQAIGGLGEAFVGGSITAGSYGTAGLVGMPVMAHGLDHFFTGAKAVYYGTPQDTVTSTALQKAGLSSHTANLVDSGLSIAGSVGGALAIQKSCIAAYSGSAWASVTPVTAGNSYQSLNRGAESVNSAVNLNRKLAQLQDIQQAVVRTRILPDGRIRYYQAERISRTSGPTRGSAYAVEYHPVTGKVRGWNECYNHLGEVNRVHPKNINGQELTSPHYPPTARELLR